MTPSPTLAEFVERHVSGAARVTETVGATLARLADADAAELGAISEILEVPALERAAELDRALASGAPGGPLCGVPFALKANLCLTGVVAHCGSRMLAGWRAPYTATALQRLLDAGAIPVATTHMDEFAMGSSGEHSAFGATRNPWSRAHAPGGSSSGSAAAVAARLVPFALGSDTGGSVRQPAAFCGITGFKPTYGRVSRYGLVAFGSSLDQVSPLAVRAADCERVLEVVSGRDARDATALPIEPFAPDPEPARDLTGLTIGVPTEYLAAAHDAGLRACFEAALATFEGLGARVVRVHLPHTELALATYYVVATAEASANLARYDGVRYGLRAPGDGTLQGMIRASRAAGFGPEVKRRILLGTYVLSSGYYEAWYDRALRVRRLVREDFERAFEEVNLIAGPTSPTPAFALGERMADPVAMYAADTLTVPVNLAGLPAISVPSGLAQVAGGVSLPVGLQLIGPALEDGRVLRVARCFQEHTDFHLAEPAPSSAAAAGEGRP